MLYESLPRISRCCCCLSLRTGSLLIGYFSLISSCFLKSSISWSLYRVILFVRNRKPDEVHTDEEVQRIATVVYLAHAYFLVIFIFDIILSLLLIIGVHRNKLNFLGYYFKGGLFLLGLALALVVISTVFMGFFAAVPLLSWCVLLLFFIIVVRSTYLEMEERIKPRVHEMTTIYSPVHTTQDPELAFI